MKSYINQSRRPITDYVSTTAITAGWVVPAVLLALMFLAAPDRSAYAPFFSIPTSAQPQMADSFGGGR